MGISYLKLGAEVSFHSLGQIMDIFLIQEISLCNIRVFNDHSLTVLVGEVSELFLTLFCMYVFHLYKRGLGKKMRMRALSPTVSVSKCP